MNELTGSRSREPADQGHQGQDDGGRLRRHPRGKRQAEHARGQRHAEGDARDDDKHSRGDAAKHPEGAPVVLPLLRRLDRTRTQGDAQAGTRGKRQGTQHDRAYHVVAQQVEKHLDGRRQHQETAHAHEGLANAQTCVKGSPRETQPGEHRPVEGGQDQHERPPRRPRARDDYERHDKHAQGKHGCDYGPVPRRVFSSRKAVSPKTHPRCQHAAVLHDLEPSVHDIAGHALRRVAEAHGEAQAKKRQQRLHVVIGLQLCYPHANAMGDHAGPLPCNLLHKDCSPSIDGDIVHGAPCRTTATGHIYRQLAARRAGPVVPRLVRAVKWEGIRPANARRRLPEPVAAYEPLREWAGHSYSSVSKNTTPQSRGRTPQAPYTPNTISPPRNRPAASKPPRP